ncbi:hypothetical protein [Microlunatus sp. GCM10028923]|uniref:hypothetical protein n=1 Tax=Microlunatus sp. GCM10028923 TaxID=3273400 RepID=UPI003608D7D3
MAGKPNERLAALMRDADLSNKRLARRVRELSVRAGKPLPSNHTDVTRWLKGTVPRAYTVSLIAEAMTDLTGRPVSPADIGFPGAIPSINRAGLDYGATEAPSTLLAVMEADLADVQAIVRSELDAQAGPAAALQWLTDGDQPMPENTTGQRVGLADVAAVQATTAAFARLDDTYGGDHARRALVEFLRNDAKRLLTGRYSEPIGRELHRTIAEATLLAAWMSYDAGRHGLAQRYFTLALGLARSGNDQLLAGSVLDAMSHQATFLGRGTEAATLAKAALAGTRSVATPTLNAHFLLMEARGLSVSGDAVGAERALSKAVGIFDRRRPDDDPEWIRYVDDRELNAEFSHCYQALGWHHKVDTYAIQSQVGSPRSDFFTSMLRATAQLSGPAADIESACAIASEALDAGEHLKSHRAVSYVADFQAKLAGRDRVAAVVDLVERNAENRMWNAGLRTASKIAG